MINKKPPYAGTTADVEKSRGQIDRLLRDYGASGVQWTTDYAKNEVVLAFSFETEINGVKKLIGIKVTPPVFAEMHRSWSPKEGRNIKVYAPNWAQSFRLLYWWLKTKIEAVSYGMTSIEQEFLSQVMTKLPSGETTTIGKALAEKGTLASGEFALEDKSEPARAYSYSEEKREEFQEGKIVE